MQKLHLHRTLDCWLFVCVMLLGCNNQGKTAVDDNIPIEPTIIADATELPTQTAATATALPLPTATTTPTSMPEQSNIPPLDSIASLLNDEPGLQGIETFMANEFSLHPLPFTPQIMPREQAVPNLRIYLGATPQIEIVAQVPDAIDVVHWVGNSADFVAYTTGWGVSGSVVGLMLFRQTEAGMLWSGLMLSADNFVIPPELATVPLPLNLTYQSDNQLFVVTNDGAASIFEMEDDSNVVYLLNSLNSHLFELRVDADHPNRAAQVALIELPTGARQPLELPYIVARTGLGWIDAQRLGMTVWLDEADMIGQTTGRPAIFNSASGEWTLLADEHAIISEVGNGRFVTISGDEMTIWRETGATQQPFSGDGLPLLSHSQQQWLLFTSGRIAIADADGQTDLLTYRAFSPHGRFLTQAAWSPDDAWAAFQPATEELEFNGVWLYSVLTDEMIHLGSGTANPLWQDSDTVLFNALVDGVAQLHAYRITSAQRVKIDLPANSQPLQFVDTNDP